MKGYVAGPLFTMAEREFNLVLANAMTMAGFEVFLPQHECEGCVEDEIYKTCKRGLDDCDVVIANLDGADADSGTCWECGYACAKSIPVIAFRTDIRLSGDIKGFNAMIYYSAKEIISNPKDLINEIMISLMRLKRENAKL